MSASDLFRVKIGQWKNQTDAKLDALARQTCGQLSENVHADTPRDVGFLAGSWQPSIGAPATGEASGQDELAAVQIAAVIADIKAGDRFYMTNNAAYAKRLEFGFVGEDSLGRVYDQAGRYFVTDNVKRWPLVVRQVAKEIGLTK